ncbi:MAG: TerD family protein [Spirochaetaceae bacterium]|nr:TerD family protein [Spirochaetaceae bacterium]
MAISLKKGQKVDLTKGNPGLSKIIVGLGWDTNKYDGRADFDLDTAAFLLTENGKVSNEKDFVFYSNLKHPSGGVTHLGDNRSGIGEGDDEQIKVDLARIPQSINKVDFTVTIYEAESRRQNFGQVSNAYIRVYDEEKKAELLRYDLGEDYSIETAVVVAELYRNGPEWKFNAIGMGFQGGLGALAANFGIAIE